MSKLRKRIHEIVEPSEPGDVVSWLFDILIVLLIIADIAVFIIEIDRVAGLAAGESDAEALKHVAGGTMWRFTHVVLFVFVIEYFLRLWAAGEELRYGGIRGRLRYVFTPMALVDFVAIIPAFAVFGAVAVPEQLAAVRVFRLLKLVRYFEPVRVMGRAIWRVRRELGAMLLTLSMVVLVTSLLIWRFEHDSNEDIATVPQAMWWVVVTMTTVGYGDAIPMTTAGRVLATLLMIFGIAMFALPAGLLGAAFNEEVTIQMERRRRRRDRKRRKAKQELLEETLEAGRSERPEREPRACPHCGKSLHAPEPGTTTS